MSWWDRVRRWVMGVVDGRSNPAVRELSEADRVWLLEVANGLDGATRSEAGRVGFEVSDELARSIAGRLRAIAG
jgi:hypothetical protein